MEIKQYINHLKYVYGNLIQFFDSESNFSFKDLIDLLNVEILDDRRKLYHFLRLISKVSNEYHRYTGFFDKIQQIILYFKKNIKENFSNLEVLQIFMSNKLILLFLIENEIIKIDELIIEKILERYLIYGKYFYPEFEPFYNERDKEYFKNPFYTISDFDEKRHIGENDSYICSLIRNDSVKEFISYINKNVIPLSSQIQRSIFETNNFIIIETPTLIEYAAFYGSIQIFQYLKMNNVQLTSSLWLYAIHGNNPEIIHILEENKVELIRKKFDDCYIESIKCHHNNFAQYFKDRIEESNEFVSCEKFDEYFVQFYLRYDNFEFLQYDLDERYIDFYIRYNYIEIVKILLDINRLDINKSMVLKSNNFF